MEHLLSMPITPSRGDVSKIIPYVGAAASSRRSIIGIGVLR